MFVYVFCSFVCIVAHESVSTYMLLLLFTFILAHMKGIVFGLVCMSVCVYVCLSVDVSRHLLVRFSSNINTKPGNTPNYPNLD